MLEQGPVTEDKIRELDEGLLEAERIKDSMDVATLDGFLTAVVCGPNTVMRSASMR